MFTHDREIITERSRESRIETMTDQLIPLFRSLTHAKRSPAIFNRYYSSVKRFVRIKQEFESYWPGSFLDPSFRAMLKIVRENSLGGKMKSR